MGNALNGETNMAKGKPVLTHVTYMPKKGKEKELMELVKKHWPVLVKAGLRPYLVTGGAPHLAGYHSGISIDPSTGSAFWAANEYATDTASPNWGSSTRSPGTSTAGCPHTWAAFHNPSSS